jgi:hypothetical protein
MCESTALVLSVENLSKPEYGSRLWLEGNSEVLPGSAML